MLNDWESMEHRSERKYSQMIGDIESRNVLLTRHTFVWSFVRRISRKLAKMYSLSCHSTQYSQTRRHCSPSPVANLRNKPLPGDDSSLVVDVDPEIMRGSRWGEVSEYE
jgi:hypothetical protein